MSRKASAFKTKLDVEWAYRFNHLRHTDFKRKRRLSLVLGCFSASQFHLTVAHVLRKLTAPKGYLYCKPSCQSDVLKYGADHDDPWTARKNKKILVFLNAHASFLLYFALGYCWLSSMGKKKICAAPPTGHWHILPESNAGFSSKKYTRFPSLYSSCLVGQKTLWFLFVVILTWSPVHNNGACFFKCYKNNQRTTLTERRAFPLIWIIFVQRISFSWRTVGSFFTLIHSLRPFPASIPAEHITSYDLCVPASILG